MSERTIVVVPDAAALAQAAAERFVALARAAQAARGTFTVALSGGSTPRAMYERLAEPPLREQVDWERVQLFWSDERYVPPDDPQSNYWLAREHLLARVHIPAANIFLMPTVGSPPEHAADAYAETLRATLGGDVPRLDLILLGMGPDGHTASLFPHAQEVVTPSDALVVAVHDAPKPPSDRLSFTITQIAAGRTVLVVVGGTDKAETLRDVLYGRPDPQRLPSQQIRVDDGALVWLLDAAAARLLDQR